MRYFHRTSLPAKDVFAEADRFFGERLTQVDAGPRAIRFTGTVGEVSVEARAEGGHYTLVVVETNDVGESEADKLAKRFLTMVHKRVEPSHVARGAY